MPALKKSHSIKLRRPFTFIKLPLAMLASAICLEAHSAFDIDISSSEANKPFQSFTIDIRSETELKFVEYFSYPSQFCDINFFPQQPQSISGTQYSIQENYNFGQHRYANGDSICLYVEDEAGNKQAFSSEATVALTAPEFYIEHVSATESSHLLFERSNEQGLFVNRAKFIFRETNAGKTALFNFKGKASVGTVMQLKSYNGTIIKSSEVNSNGQWHVDDVAVNLPEDSVKGSGNFYLTSVLVSDTDIELGRERLTVQGEKVFIDLLSQPLDPVDERQYDSATIHWDLRSPINVNYTRILMVDDSEQCHSDGPIVSSQSLVINNTRFNFFDHRELLGRFACLQLEDDQGRLFNQPIGWARKQPLPEIIVRDDIAHDVHFSDGFEADIRGAAEVKIRYLSDLGIQSRDMMWQACQVSVNGLSGTHVNPEHVLLELSDPSLHDRYVCIGADNGYGGVSHWMSEHKLNLMSGISVVANLQARGDSTPAPTALDIPLALQGSTIATAGCRGVLLSEDVMLTAGHCEAPFFHPSNGTWGLAPTNYSFLAAADEANNKIAESMEQALYERLRNDPNYHYTQFIEDRNTIKAQYGQYHTSAYHAWISPYFGSGHTADQTFADVAFRRLETPYSNPTGTVKYPRALVYSHPSELHLTKGEYRSHGIHELTPHSGWRGGDIHVLPVAGTSIVEYTLVETAGGESGSALWAFDEVLDEYGIIGAVRGGGAWSSLWSHGRVTRQELADSRLRTLQSRRLAYQENNFNYRDLRRSVAAANIDQITTIINSGVDVNRNDQGQLDGWMLARAIDFASQAYAKLLRFENEKHQGLFDQRIATIKALMLGGADPRLTIMKPTRYMNTEAGDSVLHYAVRENNSQIFKALWLHTTDYAFESSSRILPNAAGETPLSIAAANNTEWGIVKMLFTDIGDDLQLNNEANLLDKLVTAETLTEHQVRILSWIAKAYLYEPVSISNDKITSDPWKTLLCHRVSYQGNDYGFNELVQIRRNQLNEQSIAAISALGNIAGVDASRYYCKK